MLFLGPCAKFRVVPLLVILLTAARASFLQCNSAHVIFAAHLRLLEAYSRASSNGSGSHTLCEERKALSQGRPGAAPLPAITSSRAHGLMGSGAHGLRGSRPHCGDRGCGGGHLSRLLGCFSPLNLCSDWSFFQSSTRVSAHLESISSRVILSTTSSLTSASPPSSCNSLSSLLQIQVAAERRKSLGHPSV